MTVEAPTAVVVIAPSEAKLKSDYLLKLVDSSIDRLRRTRDLNKYGAVGVRMTTLIGSTIVTIFLGLTVKTSLDLKQWAFAIGAVVTLLNAIEPFFSFRKLWVEHDQALGEMYQVRSDLGFYMSGRQGERIDADMLGEFHEQYKRIWDRLNKLWVQYRRGKAESNITPAPQSKPLGHD